MQNRPERRFDHCPRSTDRPSIDLAITTQKGSPGPCRRVLSRWPYLIYWSIAAFCLLCWDVLPELSLGYAPDLRSIAFAGVSNEAVRWSIQVIDDPKTPDIRRTVGAAITGTSRRPTAGSS